MIVFMILAAVGFVASAIVHAESWGPRPLGIEQTWPLHVGIFIVFIPAVLGQKQPSGNSAAARQARRKGPQYEYAPRWMRSVLSVCGAYALVNFVAFMVMLTTGTAAHVHQRNGRYVILQHHQIVRAATPDEVRSYRGLTARGFSGHWMVFYWASLVGLVDLRRRSARQAAAEQRLDLAPGERRPPRRYGGAPPALELWGHTVLLFGGSIVCFFAFPLTEAIFFISLQERYYPRIKVFGGIAVLLFIPAALLGLLVASRLLRKIPARCPRCGGRAYFTGGILGSSRQSRPYRCTDCGLTVDQAETG
jgi:hypothetical protein